LERTFRVYSLFGDVDRSGALVLVIGFLLSHMFAWPRQSKGFLKHGLIFEGTFAEFDGLGHIEKDNFVTMV
jgi:hypothetical protein